MWASPDTAGTQSLPQVLVFLTSLPGSGTAGHFAPCASPLGAVAVSSPSHLPSPRRQHRIRPWERGLTLHRSAHTGVKSHGAFRPPYLSALPPSLPPRPQHLSLGAALSPPAHCALCQHLPAQQRICCPRNARLSEPLPPPASCGGLGAREPTDLQRWRPQRGSFTSHISPFLLTPCNRRTGNSPFHSLPSPRRPWLTDSRWAPWMCCLGLEEAPELGPPQFLIDTVSDSASQSSYKWPREGF